MLARSLPSHPLRFSAPADPRAWRERIGVPPGFFEGQRWCFIASQRILAALADILVVVDAGGFSLAALTSQLATDLGRDIAVVPCRLTDPGGQRMLRLLRDGVPPVANAEDVLELIHGAGARRPAISGPEPREVAA